MKKTLIALMALASVACAGQLTMTAGGNLYADAFKMEFTIDALPTEGYDILAAYYQANNRSGYTVNAFELSADGVLTLNRGNTLTLTEGELTNDSVLTTQDKSTFVGYTLTAGTYVLEYLGGTNGSAAANLYFDGEVVASFTGGNHNMNGSQGGGLALTLLTNDSYKAVMIPEPATATLSLLALAGLCARRRRA